MLPSSIKLALFESEDKLRVLVMLLAAFAGAFAAFALTPSVSAEASALAPI